jgi:acylphosphatase
MVSTTEHQRREVCYSGRVQGVGFRFTVFAIAARFSVTGFVQNLSDGRVRLVVEGEPQEIGRFVDAIHEQMRRYIVHAHELVSPANGQFHSFEIKH